MWAVERRDAVATDLLLQAGASADKANHRGQSPITVTGDISCLKLLLRAGANITRAKNDKRTFLHHLHLFSKSSPSDLSEAIRQSVAAGADLEARDICGSTPLSQYAIETIAAAIKALLDHGANINCLDNDGDTPLNNAIFHCNDVNTKLLLEHRALYTLLNHNNESILHMTARYGNLDIVRVLSAARLRGIATEGQDNQKKTPRQLAEERNVKPDRFLDEFDELLAGIRARNEGDDRERCTTNDEQADGEQASHPDSVFVDALEQQ